MTRRRRPNLQRWLGIGRCFLCTLHLAHIRRSTTRQCRRTRPRQHYPAVRQRRVHLVRQTMRTLRRKTCFDSVHAFEYSLQRCECHHTSRGIRRMSTHCTHCTGFNGRATSSPRSRLSLALIAASNAPIRSVAPYAFADFRSPHPTQLKICRTPRAAALILPAREGGRRGQGSW